MEQEKSFYKEVLSIALPVTLQSLLQSSFSVIDQVMTGQLGSTSIAGIGLASKFSSLFSVLLSAVAAVAGIMIAQYIGKKDDKEVSRSFFVNFFVAVFVALFFTIICSLFPSWIMGAYTEDATTKEVAAGYLRIVAISYFPMVISTLFATLMRCMDAAVLPLCSSIFAAVVNTGLNYLLIFGKFGFASMGAEGAAIATVISQCANFLVMLLMIMKYSEYLKKSENDRKVTSKVNWNQYLNMLLPILICEIAWSLGENVYAAIYGHLGTEASAAMTLTNPIQGLMIGALCGLSQAASVIIGKKLGNEEYDDAYEAAKKLIFYGFIGSIILSAFIIITSTYYVEIYQVEESTKLLTKQILIAYAIIAPFKIQNMIIGGGIIRSGGKTKYVMAIDMIGTWGFGVPLGLLSAFVLKLSIPYVYFILSLEECIRFSVSVVVLRKKKWMNCLEAGEKK